VPRASTGQRVCLEGSGNRRPRDVAIDSEPRARDPWIVLLSPELERILQRSVDAARNRRNPTLTLEHLVYVMACDLRCSELLTACGAKVDKLFRELDRYLAGLPTTGSDDLAQAPEFQAALQRAAGHAQAVGREQFTPDGVLAALLLQKDAYAVALLARHRVTRLSVITRISHGETDRAAVHALPRARLLGRWRPARRETADRYEVVFHNDDFTTLEFVIELMISVFERSRNDAEALTQEIHLRGSGVVGVYAQREANQRVERASEAARAAEFPLRLSVVPAA
jgi:ATP-dependent Clp protease adapter protein ClpS